LPLGIFNEAETETVKVTEELPSVTVKSYRRRATSPISCSTIANNS